MPQTEPWEIVPQELPAPRRAAANPGPISPPVNTPTRPNFSHLPETKPIKSSAKIAGNFAQISILFSMGQNRPRPAPRVASGP